MTPEKRPLDAIRAIRKRLEDPYAYIDDLEERAQSALHLSENPYAILADWNGVDGGEARAPDVQSASATRPSLKQSIRAGLSKADFRSGSTRIFLQYVPPHLPRRIPSHQRDFIARNEHRSPRVRFRLMESLKRYDLSTTVGISPQFNRELSTEISEQKLRSIEAEVHGDD